MSCLSQDSQLRGFPLAVFDGGAGAPSLQKADVGGTVTSKKPGQKGLQQPVPGSLQAGKKAELWH